MLPSPNGSAIAASVSETQVVAACLRNYSAVADWLVLQGWGTPTQPIAIVAAGEQWPGTATVRPALEDWLGAGALAAALLDRGIDAQSPEALSAAGTFRALVDVPGLLRTSASGRELVSGGFPDDVAIAVDLDADTTVPVLDNGAFTDHSH